MASSGSSWLRAALVALFGGFGAVGHSTAEVLVVVSVSGGLVLASCFHRRLRAASPGAAPLLNAALVVLLGLSQLVLGPQADGGWIVATASIVSITCYFEWPERPWAGHLLAVATVGSYGLGCVLGGGPVPALPAGRMLVQAMLAFLGLLATRRVARLFDALCERQLRRRSAAAALRAQRDADRAYLAMLHDTASTTFLMVSTGSVADVGWLPGQARRDLDLLSTQWDPGHEVELSGMLATLDEPGLDLRLRIQEDMNLPSGPALAIFHGVREALRNVRHHAGTRAATVTAHERRGWVEAVVSDSGRGFDPERVPPHRQGLAQSIRARSTAAGVGVDVRSAPAEGTTVTWRWRRD
ncbi:sensor histidine kinase [Amycolatopsis suaedae]|uniref:Histidine kinase/HSP90-like ATPase domain-containing protein n=1 Tax=Amycolatopsis suaedae TaxID=2510978 RepID=A0A4Q7JBZ3_9PSEU|nr:ATP-binding protein [Amycolatopsis suaedae]RZQ64817.1 hypothetical protein EWH70_08000 [Amycolatopsis suaedae]